MAVEMKALRRLYVRPHRREFEKDGQFTVPTDEEADRLVRRHKAVRADAQNPTDLPKEVLPTQPIQPAQPAQAQEPQPPPLEEPRKRHYRRRDMVAEESGPTGEDGPSQS